MPFFWIVWLSLLGVLILFSWDVRRNTRFVRRYHELNNEGNWEELERLLKRELRTIHPLAGWLIHLKAAGAVETMYALHLYERGRIEEGLTYAQTAVRKAGHRRGVLTSALNTQALCLIELKKYEDIRPIADRLRSIGAAYAGDYTDAVSGFYQGRLDEALQAALRSCRDPKGVLCRGTASVLFLLKGDAKSALEILLDKVPDVTIFYKEKVVEKIGRTSGGRALLEAHKKQYAGVMEPLRFIRAAYVCLDMGDEEGLRYALERAGEVMGGHRTIQVMERQMSACLSALTGDAAGTERRLQEGAQVLEMHSRRSSMMEFHRYSGRAWLTLGRADAALAAFEAAMKVSRHPIELHLAHYWLAQARQARGETAQALEHYRAVVGDGIASKYREVASKALAG